MRDGLRWVTVQPIRQVVGGAIMRTTPLVVDTQMIEASLSAIGRPQSVPDEVAAALRTSLARLNELSHAGVESATVQLGDLLWRVDIAYPATLGPAVSRGEPVEASGSRNTWNEALAAVQAQAYRESIQLFGAEAAAAERAGQYSRAATAHRCAAQSAAQMKRRDLVTLLLTAAGECYIRSAEVENVPLAGIRAAYEAAAECFAAAGDRYRAHQSTARLAVAQLRATANPRIAGTSRVPLRI